MTFTQLKAELKNYGMVATKNDGEIRVNFKNGKEETAYYTNDIEDAHNTAKHMFFFGRN